MKMSKSEHFEEEQKMAILTANCKQSFIVDKKQTKNFTEVKRDTKVFDEIDNIISKMGNHLKNDTNK